MFRVRNSFISAKAALAIGARAQAYPARPVRLIEGFGAGGAADIVARLIGQSLSERLGQSFVIENRSGAASNIATEAVVRAAPDGYTLLTASNAINATLYEGAEEAPSLTVTVRDGDGNMRSGRKNARGAGRTKNEATKHDKNGVMHP